MALLIPSCAKMQAKKPVFKNTRWICVQKIFVADAGMMTQTYEMEFVSDKECVWTDKWVLPAHPAMYMNPDGTVDRIPESGSESVSHAAWRYRRGELTLQFEDGFSRVLRYKEDHLTCPGLLGEEEMVFVQVYD